MTWCYHRGEAPHLMDEAKGGAYCAKAGATLLWHGDPITADDLAPAAPDADEPAE